MPLARRVAHSWHQDSGISSKTVLLGFPPRNGYVGGGVFSSHVKLSHPLKPTEGEAHEVKRKSRMRAFDKFDEAKRERNKAKRRKPASEAAEAIRPAATAIVAAGFATPTLPVAVPTALADAGEPPDVATQRDWALLRAFKLLPSPDAVLDSLRSQGLDDEDEPWTVLRVQERHDFCAGACPEYTQCKCASSTSFQTA